MILVAGSGSASMFWLMERCAACSRFYSGQGMYLFMEKAWATWFVALAASVAVVPALMLWACAFLFHLDRRHSGDVRPYWLYRSCLYAA